MKRLCSSWVQYSRRLVRTYFLRGCFCGSGIWGVGEGFDEGEGGGDVIFESEKYGEKEVQSVKREGDESIDEAMLARRGG